MTRSEQAVKDYFAQMMKIRGTGGGTEEESYYPPLKALMDEIGGTMPSPVMCVSQLRNQGADHPDFGLYAESQFGSEPPVLGHGEHPKHGVIEAKGLGEDLEGILDGAHGDQMRKYINGYGLAMATNYRQFRLYGKGKDGAPKLLEDLTISTSAEDFWEQAQKPQRAAREHGIHVSEFLRRSLNHASVILRPEDVAWFLASYAREALANIETVNQSAPDKAFKNLRETLKIGLDLPFEGKDGDHLFCSTMVQTLFYGLFSAWVRDGKGGNFGHGTAKWDIPVPVIQSLFEQLTMISQMRHYALEGILDRTADMLNRIDRDAFLESFMGEEAIQHFYELFLAEFDPETREDKGVWYTPREIVRYMVDRVDQVLRSELGYSDGLADSRVYVLDPCCGTGAYILDVLRKIRDIHEAKGVGNSVAAQHVKEAATKRVFGFEVMASPLVIAHYQIGAFLDGVGASLAAESAGGGVGIRRLFT